MLRCNIPLPVKVPPSGGEKGSRCETGAVPATVSGELVLRKG